MIRRMLGSAAALVAADQRTSLRSEPSCVAQESTSVCQRVLKRCGGALAAETDDSISIVSVRLASAKSTGCPFGREKQLIKLQWLSVAPRNNAPVTSQPKKTTL